MRTVGRSLLVLLHSFALLAIIAAAAGPKAIAQPYGVNTRAQATANASTNGTVQYDGNTATQNITQGIGGTVTYSNSPNVSHLIQSSGQVTASIPVSTCPPTGCISGTQVASAFATADLTSGSVGVQASANFAGGISAASGTASLSESLTFHIPGANSSTVTNLGISFQVDGTYALAAAAGSPSNSLKAIMNFGSGIIYYQFNSPLVPSNSIVQNSGWVSQQIDAQTGNSFLFTAVYAVTGANPVVPVEVQMSLTCQSAACDYSRTGAINFNLPAGVTFTSSSGAFLNRPIAHAADGNNFKTTVLLTNSSTVLQPYSLRFNDEEGNVPATGFQLELGALTGTIAPGASTTIRTAGLGSQTLQGWAELTASPEVGGSVIYSQQTALPSIQEGTTSVGTPGSLDFFVPFDNTNGAVTSMAITNPGLLAATMTVLVRLNNGTIQSVPFVAIPSRSHQAFAIPNQFLATANQSGVIEFTSTVPLLAVAFRFNSTGAFTAFDVVSVPASQSLGLSSPDASNPTIGSLIRTIAHAADGNNFKTTVVLTNASTSVAPYTLRFDDAQGNVPASAFQLETGSLTGTIQVGRSVTIRTSGAGNQTFQGWAELTAPGTIGGSVIYSQQTGLPSLQEGTAAIANVGSATADLVVSGSKEFFVPFDNTVGAVTSMALTNSGAVIANITVTLRYNNGTSETIAYPQLQSRTHQAFEMRGQFPNSSGRAGVAEFVSDVPVSAVVFRFNSTGAFTALGTVAH